MVMSPDVCACAYASNLFQRQCRASLYLYLTCNVYVHLVINVKSIVFKFDVALIRSASAYIMVTRATFIGCHICMRLLSNKIF